MHDNHFRDLERADSAAYILCSALGFVLGLLVFLAAVAA